jgi:hypothetical protein
LSERTAALFAFARKSLTGTSLIVKLPLAGVIRSVAARSFGTRRNRAGSPVSELDAFARRISRRLQFRENLRQKSHSSSDR